MDRIAIMLTVRLLSGFLYTVTLYLNNTGPRLNKGGIDLKEN